MPWLKFSDTEKMQESALSAKTLVAEVRSRGARHAARAGQGSNLCFEAAEQPRALTGLRRRARSRRGACSRGANLRGARLSGSAAKT